MAENATGRAVKLYGKNPSTPGDFNAGNAFLLPFLSNNLGSTIPLLQDPALSHSETTNLPGDPQSDRVQVQNTISVPVDFRAIGFWLKHLCGSYSVTGNGPYTHVFEIDGTRPDDFDLYAHFTDITQYRRYLGYMINSFAINIGPSGQPDISIQMNGLKEESGLANDPGTATVWDYKRIGNTSGSIKQDGSLLGSITGGQMTFANNLDVVNYVQADAAIGAIDMGQPSMSGNISARLPDLSLIALAEASTPLELEFLWAQGTQSLSVKAERVFLEKGAYGVNGPGGIDYSANFQGAKDPSTDLFATFTLINDVASYAAV